MKCVKPLTLALALVPALALAHPGHPGHDAASGLAQSPALGVVAGLLVAALVAARWLTHRARTTAARRR